MKRLLFSLAFVLCQWAFCLAQPVYFSISDGIDNPALKTKIEREVSMMLTEINAAQSADRNLNFAAMGHPSIHVQRSLASLWENTPFVCIDDEIVEHCITTATGYQVRNIPLMMRPVDEEWSDDDEYQEAVISFDRQGNVESFYFTISMNPYMNIIKNNMELTDLRRRQMILNYVEQFRTSYNQKDIHFLNQVFSDDALIITGKVITQKHPEGFVTQKIRYNKQNKQQYLDNLKRVFKVTKYIHVSFDDIEVMRHPTNPNIYGVTLHQGWTSNTYHDEGYVFLLWDFRDEDAPEIHVRTWQPDRFEGKALARDEVFSLSDFDIE